MRRTLARLGLVLLFVGAVPTLGPGTAHACSCVPSTDAAAFARASDVFTGTLVNREVPNTGSRTSSIDPAIHTFAVDRVYKGTATDPQRVVSFAGGASCGLELRGPGPFVVFAGRGEGGAQSLADYRDLPKAFLCDGSRALAANETLPFGPGAAPAAASTSSPSSPSTDTPSILGPSSDAEEDDGPGTSTAVALGVAAVALIAGGIVLRTRGRR